MVMIKRRMVPMGSPVPSPRSQVPYGGDGRISPTSYILGSPESGTTSSVSLMSSSGASLGGPMARWVKLGYGLLVFSWISGYGMIRQTERFTMELQLEKASTGLQYDMSVQTLRDAEESRSFEKRRVRQLQQTNHVFHHEVRILEEVAEAGKTKVVQRDVERAPPSDEIVVNWLKQRKDALHSRVDALQTYIQEESRKQVAKKYGEGPHRVKFTVEFIQSKETMSFIVQLAPLRMVPHSVHVFLEMVYHGVWENTVFWHHEEADHILSAAPVVFSSGQTKTHHIQALGLGGVSFGEYSPAFPHHKYTLGFAGTGPEFYINTKENVVAHGTGGRGHRQELPHEADPCFGSVIEGRAVIDKMNKIRGVRSKQNREHDEDKDQQEDWHDDYDVTRIVKLELLD